MMLHEEDWRARDRGQSGSFTLHGRIRRTVEPEQADLRPSEEPAFWHCKSRFVQMPEAHERPLPHDVPSLWYWSDGQEKLFPLQTSAMSHFESTAARQTVPFEAIWHCDVQHSELRGSQTAPLANLQVEASQQGSLAFWPGSHSSPSSRMPLPHDWSLFARQRYELVVGCQSTGRRPRTKSAWGCRMHPGPPGKSC